jgi:hypothetical protein
MAMRRIGTLAAITIGLLAPAASAQDDPRVGITMGYPASVGIIWQVNDRVALRPEVSVQKSSGEFTSTTSFSVGATTATTTTTSTSDAWQVGVGLSALFYLTTHDALRTYVSPRWSYVRTSTTSSSAGLPPPIQTSSSVGNGQFVSGSFGAQYALGKRFGLFGEVGVGYTHADNTPSLIGSGVIATQTTTRTLGTRSGAGVIWYF